MLATQDLDSALIDLAAHGSSLRNGFTNHAPMVAEALETLGRADAIAPWLAGYQPQILPRLAATGCAPTERCAALGRPEFEGDWREAVEAELAREPWPGVLARWTAALSPAAGAGALHGLIRVGHAARGLARADTPPRRAELAAAIASWASMYAELPIAPPATREPRSAADALAGLTRVPPEQRRNGGSIVAALAALEGHAPFAQAFHTLDIDHLDDTVRDLSDFFARVFLANVDSPLHAIVFTHAITGTAAARNLLPFLSDEAGGALLRHVWHAGAALYAAYATQAPDPVPAASAQIAPANLVARAIANGDDHVIKLTEAVLTLPLEPGLAEVVSLRAMEML